MLSHSTPRRLASAALPSVPRALLEIRRAPAVIEAGRTALSAILETLGRELDAPFECRLRQIAPPVGSLRFGSGRAQLMLTFAATGRRALLEIDEGFSATLVDRLAGASVAAAAPGPLSSAEVAALSFLALCALRAARSAQLVEDALAVRFVGIASSPVEAAQFAAAVPEWLAFDLDLRLADVAGEGRLLLPASDLAIVGRRNRTPCAAPAASTIASARFEGTVFAGQTELSADELAQLGPGDAVVLANLERLEGALAGAARISFAGFEIHGALAGSALTVSHLQLFQSPEAVMPTPPRPPPLPVEIEIELARVRVPISELGQLQPGAVMELNVHLDHPVLLRVGDRVIARAELVDIDGEVGARILELLD